MPARFVEVTTPLNLAEAARKTDPLSVLSSIGIGRLAGLNFTEGFYTSVAGGAGAGFAPELRPPEGTARALLVTACVLWVLRVALLRSATRRAVSEFGHAHHE